MHDYMKLSYNLFALLEDFDFCKIYNDCGMFNYSLYQHAINIEILMLIFLLTRNPYVKWTQQVNSFIGFFSFFHKSFIGFLYTRKDRLFNTTAN